MIAHSIEVHKEIFQPYRVPYQPPFQHRPVEQRHFDYSVRYNKLQYAEYLGRMYLKKGSWVAKTGKWPIPQGGLFYVCDIQEIHFMVEYEGSQPKSVQVMNDKGEKFWVVPGHYYTVLYPPKDIVWEVPT